jgi:tRNA threonylcarbamoyladenosine biosynthesis protein TsaB
MKLLALDTASGLCSAALLVGEAVSVRELLTARDHARELLPMVQSLLAEAGMGLAGLDAIAFGRGPGSFTGLRIAASVTQGLAFGADLPVLPVSDLRALAQLALDAAGGPGAAPSGRILACLDARMHEVYAAAFTVPRKGWVADAPEVVIAPTRWVEQLLAEAIHGPQVLAAGKGLGAYADELAPLRLDPARCWPDAEPSARQIARLAAQDLAAGLAQPAEAAVPVYLRDQVTHRPVS